MKIDDARIFDNVHKFLQIKSIYGFYPHFLVQLEKIVTSNVFAMIKDLF